MKTFLLLALLACVSFARAGEEGSLYDLEAVWTNQEGAPFPLARLRGQPRLLVMFFSHCSYACPRITADLKKIEQRLSPDERARVGFVMASFDSERDVPATLKTFAATKELDLARWVLLHGDEDQVRELAAVLNVRYRRDENGDIDHSNLITLLDEKGRIVFQREGLEGDPDVVVKAVRELLAKAEETHP